MPHSNPTEKPALSALGDHPPLITVISPARNAGEFYPVWLSSIEAQQYPNLEVLLIDDGSDEHDSTPSLFQWSRSAPPFLHYLRQQAQGPGVARNTALQQVRGEYIAFLDLDDRWANGHLDRLSSVLQCDPDAGIAQGQIRKFVATENGKLLFCSKPYFFVNLGAALYRKTVFDEVGSFDPQLHFGEDFDFIVRCWERGISKVEVSEVSLFYHRHDGNMTNGKSVVDMGAVRVYKRRLDRMRRGEIDPALVEARRVSFADYLGRTTGPFDEGVRELFEP
jgi:glycosyltransferase involved in cell wall biosynthesis